MKKAKHQNRREWRERKKAYRKYADQISLFNEHPDWFN